MNQFALIKSNPYYLIKKNINDSIAEHAHELSGNILDFGCGSKPYKHYFNHVNSYIGIDYENDGHDHVNEDVDVYYDGKKIPFTDEYFDSVLSSEVFEHVFELDDTIREINRIMKPNGKILITCPFVWNLHEEPHDFARYTPHALSYLLEKNGFDVIKIERKGDFKEVLAQLKIIYLLSEHYLLNVTLFKTWIFNNKLFSFRAFVKKCIAYYYNSRICSHKKKKLMGSNTSLYLTNVVLARKIKKLQ